MIGLGSPSSGPHPSALQSRELGWLAASLVLAGLAGLAGAAIWGGDNAVGTAACAWLLVAAGTVISWWVTWWWTGGSSREGQSHARRQLGLVHVASGFVARALGPLTVAAILVARDPAWRAAGLLWWVLGFYLVGLVADTWVLLRLTREPRVEANGPGGE